MAISQFDRASAWPEWLKTIAMNETDHQRVINELQAVIDDTQHTLDRFEATGMDEQMPDDYEKLLIILNDAVKQQREHTLAMLEKPLRPKC